MYNLTVNEADTFFVGDGAWLVHNCSDDISVQRWENEGGFIPSAHIDPDRVFRGLGDLTVDEAKQIQSVADDIGEEIWVVGGVAQNRRTARSDIDYVVSTSQRAIQLWNEKRLPFGSDHHSTLPF
ncbi:MAG: hypothetical protein MUF87_17450 [Anaerolineae bacterium]|jgi:hypothetical protein|nr:hypothetical protein [Anaerolineae bacterium]